MEVTKKYIYIFFPPSQLFCVESHQKNGEVKTNTSTKIIKPHQTLQNAESRHGAHIWAARWAVTQTYQSQHSNNAASDIKLEQEPGGSGAQPGRSPPEPQDGNARCATFCTSRLPQLKGPGKVYFTRCNLLICCFTNCTYTCYPDGCPNAVSAVMI